MQSLRWKQKPTIKVYTTAVLSDRGHITERKATLSRYPRVSEVQPIGSLLLQKLVAFNLKKHWPETLKAET